MADVKVVYERRQRAAYRLVHRLRAETAAYYSYYWFVIRESAKLFSRERVAAKKFFAHGESRRGAYSQRGRQQQADPCANLYGDERRACLQVRLRTDLLRGKQKNRPTAANNGRTEMTPVSQQPPSITGDRTMASVNRVINQNMTAIRHAYNRRLRENPSLSGVVVVNFTIND